MKVRDRSVTFAAGLVFGATVVFFLQSQLTLLNQSSV
jgi:hypothetical protein